jgi:hypothetical protein
MLGQFFQETKPLQGRNGIKQLNVNNLIEFFGIFLLHLRHEET